VMRNPYDPPDLQKSARIVTYISMTIAALSLLVLLWAIFVRQ
jgi:hypothetical protein